MTGLRKGRALAILWADVPAAGRADLEAWAAREPLAPTDPAVGVLAIVAGVKRTLLRAVVAAIVIRIAADPHIIVIRIGFVQHAVIVNVRVASVADLILVVVFLSRVVGARTIVVGI